MQCRRQWTQGGPPALLQACIRGDVAIAPVEVLRIKHLNHSPTCILAFFGTMKHLVLPKLKHCIPGLLELPAVVAALTLLQVPPGRSSLRHYLLSQF